MAGLKQGPREARWRDLIAAAAPDVWVACDGTDVVGWASASAGRDDDGPRPLELYGIYVLASHYGSGAGQLLLDSTVGRSGAYLWIAEDIPGRSPSTGGTDSPRTGNARRRSSPGFRCASCAWSGSPGWDSGRVIPWQSARLRSRPN
ncbi:N-acetyltransferase family protein [Pseudarthrobacter sp. S9]|uniref:GNAT family N-acetyltransferase n=1 Tax=Pseudarthrobacter sp. S9 TaxID=3418421 RepID=UPI003D07F102